VLGEPLLHPRINEFIDIASKKFNINITTNGYLIDRVKDNKNIRQLNISLHSYDEKYGVSLEDYMNNSDIICQDASENCENCPLVKICSGGCVSVNKDLYNNMNLVNPYVCKEKQYYYKLSMAMMLLLNNNATFFYYLDEISS
jgi:radical SAM protein with 4Fe4S-binding SPASM domain